MNVLVIVGHPRRESLCAALAEQYANGAQEAGQQVRSLNVSELRFDPNVHDLEPAQQAVEEDLARVREWITWADHLVFVFPTWWGLMPALLKAFLDRVLMPGFAFTWHGDGTWDKLLTGKSAHLITTHDTPGWVYRWIYGAPGMKALKIATLNFCGVDPVRVSYFGTVFNSTASQRSQWLRESFALGRSLQQGVLTPAGQWRRKTGAWLRAVRLQFYPMTWIAYTVGALGAATAGVFTQSVYWLGYACLFLAEFIAVMINELVDYDSDRQNRFFGPFSGGSRVLVEGRLTALEMRRGIAVAVGALVIVAMALLSLVADATATLAVLLVGFLLAMAYTAPPVKLAYRGFGEVDVAATHSFLVLVAGYVVGGGSPVAAFPWIVGLPLFLAVVPSITLSAIPDHTADCAVGKGTLAVRFGIAGAVWVAVAATMAAAACAVLWQLTGAAGGAYAGAGFFIVPHAVWLVRRLVVYVGTRPAAGRIDGLMANALSYVLWFGLIPLWNLS